MEGPLDANASKLLYKKLMMIKNPAYQLCHEIVNDVAVEFIAGVRAKVEEYKSQRLQESVLEMAVQGWETILEYDRQMEMNIIDRRGIEVKSLKDVEPVSIGQDNYTRKVMENTRLDLLCKSESALNGLKLDKFRGTSIEMKISQKSVMRSPDKPAKAFMNLDFNVIHQQSVNPQEHKLRMEKQSAALQSHMVKNSFKVSLPVWITDR